MGSPCVPDTDIGPLPTSLIYENSDVSVNIELGERGIITSLIVDRQGMRHVLSAESCFVNDFPFDIPLGTVHRSRNGIQTKLWSINFDSIYIRVLCIREKSGDQLGIARLNIQDLSVPNTVNNNDKGICVDGTIPNIDPEDHDRSARLHTLCVENVPDALQACKASVHLAYSSHDLDECGEFFCSNADLSDKQKTKCLRSLVSNKNEKSLAKAWLTEYCRSIINSGITQLTMSRCISEIKLQGWHWAVDTWGNGRVTSVTKQCYGGVVLNDFTIEKRQQCDVGVTLDVMKDGQWTSKYYFPSYVCSDVDLEIRPEDDSELFSLPVRLSQCNTMNGAVCGVEKCKSIPDTKLSVEFESLAGRLLKMYLNDELEIRNTIHKVG